MVIPTWGVTWLKLKVGLQWIICGNRGGLWIKLKASLKSRMGGNWGGTWLKVENWWCMVKVESWLELVILGAVHG